MKAKEEKKVKKKWIKPKIEKVKIRSFVNLQIFSCDKSSTMYSWCADATLIT
jgi:hypothetical protein